MRRSFCVLALATARIALSLALVTAAVLALRLDVDIDADDSQTGKVTASLRLVVRVPAADIGRRSKDEMPAEFRLEASHFAPIRRLDPASLEVTRIDKDSDRPLSGPL